MSEQDAGWKLSIPPDLLRGRAAIITGASRGIGRSTALKMAEAGADVAINFLNQEAAAEDLARSVRARGRQALTVRANVADPEQAERLVDATAEKFGRVDILVANAGIWEGAPLEQMSEELWDRVIDANLKGTWAVCRAAVPHMKRQRRGSIVIVSSTAGQRGEAGYSNYAASKGGQISFTKSLSTELAPEIRVNCIAPGWVDTELSDPALSDGESRRSITEAIPLKRLATADDIAFSILFLASDWARHITGEVLNVNGGSVLCG